MTATQESYKSLLKAAQIYHSLDKSCYHNVEMVKDILKKEGDINQLISDSILLQSQCDLKEFTVLNLSAIERNVEVFKLLLDNGADFTLQNQHGDTVLHYLFNCEPDDTKDELISSVLSAHIQFANLTNPCDRNNISHFHIACMANHAEAVQFFLDHSASVHQLANTDSPRFPAFSPIHFAAEGCSIEVLNILLKNNADISAKDARGRTALHIFLQQKLKLFDCLKEGKKDQTILAKIDVMDDITHLLLQDNDVDDTGLSQFHIACMMHDSSIAEYLMERTTDVNHCVKFDSPVWPGYSGFHFAAHCNTGIFIKFLQREDAIQAKNAEGFFPLDIFLKKCTAKDLLSILSLNEKWTSKLTDGQTQLDKLVAAMCEPLQFESYLLVALRNINISVVEEPPFWIGFTPLHFAVLLSKNSDTKLIQMCLDCGADISTQDVHGWTPIHLAYRMNKIEATILLLMNYRETEVFDLFDEEGFSLLCIVQRLIRHPSAFHVLSSLPRWYDKKYVIEEPGLNCLHTTSYFGDIQALNRLLHNGQGDSINDVIMCDDPTMFWSKYVGYTPLHLAVERSASAVLVRALIAYGADIFARRPDGMTPLYAVLRDISKNHLMDLFVSKLQSNNLDQLSGITMLHVACRTFNVDAARHLLNTGAAVNAKVHGECPIWSGYTALHVLLKYATHVEDELIYERFQILLGMLLEHGADVTAVNGDGDTPIHLSFDHCIHDNNFLSMSVLMENHKDFSLNPVNAKNMSHFHAACIVNNIEAVAQFLQHGVDVNQPIGFFVKNFAGETPLQLALKRVSGTKNELNVMNLLVTHGANVLLEDSYSYTVLHRAACDYSSSTKLFEKLISFGADVNAKNIFGETPMEFLLKIDEISLNGVEILLDAGCRINSCNHISGEGYLAMIIDEKYHKTPQAGAFERIMTSSDLINIDEMSRTALHNIVTTSKANANIVNYEDVLDRFQKLGIDLDHQDKFGKTALHLAAQFGNIEAVVALINAGTDINIVDSNNKTALSHALQLRETNESHHEIITNALFIHVRKLQLLGLFVSELNKNLIEESHLNVSFDSGSFLDERQRLRGITVDNQPQLILDDFLLETEALAIYPFRLDSKRTEIEELLKSLGEKWIQMKSVLMLQYRKALKVALA